MSDPVQRLGLTHDIPEKPPSPYQYSIDLYSLPDVQHLFCDTSDIENFLGFSPFERAPSPLFHSIPLHPLPHLEQLAEPDSGNPAPSPGSPGRWSTIPEFTPSPWGISIDLYSLQEISHETLDEPSLRSERSNASTHVPGKAPPSLRQISIDLYAAQDVQDILDENNPTASLDRVGAETLADSADPAPKDSITARSPPISIFESESLGAANFEADIRTSRVQTAEGSMTMIPGPGQPTRRSVRLRETERVNRIDAGLMPADDPKAEPTSPPSHAQRLSQEADDHEHGDDSDDSDDDYLG